MEKRKLKKMKVLEPSEEMVLAAESDIPAIGNMAYERMEYPIGLFIQAEMDENILKIGFFCYRYFDCWRKKTFIYPVH
mgnify:CR=1 FL=1